ncbi:hypothetical protein D3C87_1674600 [compost metagenome]
MSGSTRWFLSNFDFIDIRLEEPARDVISTVLQADSVSYLRKKNCPFTGDIEDVGGRHFGKVSRHCSVVGSLNSQ